MTTIEGWHTIRRFQLEIGFMEVSMQRSWLVLVIVGAGIGFVERADAQGNSAHGLGHTATPGPAARGLSPSGRGSAQAGRGLSQQGRSLSRGLGSASKSLSGKGPSGKGLDNAGVANAAQRQLSNAEGIRDHRLDQAEHLRELGQRNGNLNLQDNADRMSQQAQQQYDRRMTQIEQHPGYTAPSATTPLPPGAGIPLPDASAAPPAAAADTAPATAPTGRPGFGQRLRGWFRFRS